jgi:predicted acetyltransferase
MDVEILKATVDDKPVLRRMLELYLYDLSAFQDSDLNCHGEFGYGHLDHYWREDGRHAFLVRRSGKLVGFVLVNTHGCAPDSHFSIAEFFVMRRYRRQGIGRAMAFHVWDTFPGRWEVGQLPGNVPAQRFWRAVVEEYTGGKFEISFNAEGGPLLRFATGRQPTVPSS